MQVVDARNGCLIELQSLAASYCRSLDGHVIENVLRDLKAGLSESRNIFSCPAGYRGLPKSTDLRGWCFELILTRAEAK